MKRLASALSHFGKTAPPSSFKPDRITGFLIAIFAIAVFSLFAFQQGGLPPPDFTSAAQQQDHSALIGDDGAGSLLISFDDTVNATTGQDDGHSYFGLPIDVSESGNITFLTALFGTGAVILATGFYFVYYGLRKAGDGERQQLNEYSFLGEAMTVGGSSSKGLEKRLREMGRVAQGICSAGYDLVRACTGSIATRIADIMLPAPAKSFSA